MTLIELLENIADHTGGNRGASLWAHPEVAGVTEDSAAVVLASGAKPPRGWVNLGCVWALANTVKTVDNCGMDGVGTVLDFLTTGGRHV